MRARSRYVSRITAIRARITPSRQTGYQSASMCGPLKQLATVLPDPAGPMIRSIGPRLLMNRVPIGPGGWYFCNEISDNGTLSRSRPQPERPMTEARKYPVPVPVK